MPKYTKFSFGFLLSILSNLDANQANVNLFVVLKLTARVQRALSDVQAAKKRGGGQKRDVMEVRKVDELENRAAELLKRLDTKEG